jgi:hypothetical protein
MSTLEVNKPGLRPHTKLQKQRLNLVYNCEGLGGYIQWTTAMQWVYETNEHLSGTVFCTSLFFELAKRWFWHLRDRVDVKMTGRVLFKDLEPIYGPNHISPNGFQLLTPLATHPLRLGFHYFANIDYIPEGYDRLPYISGNEVSIKKFGLPEKYVVITTEATTPSRMLKAETINGISAHLRGRNITPVFLGKKHLSSAVSANNRDTVGPYIASSPDGLNLDGVIDLREKTSLLEAACILANAKVVAGLDNGLLHLASCSEVPVIWGFNTVNPTHRLPPRPNGAKNFAIVPPESLPCRFCQSNAAARYVNVNYDFRNCLYGDFACLETLTADPFIKAIDSILT